MTHLEPEESPMLTFFTSAKGGLTLILVLAVLWFFIHPNPDDNPSSASLPAPGTLSAPTVLGLSLGMTISEAEEVISKNLRPFLFMGNEFSHNPPFEPGSDAYEDAEILRQRVRFRKKGDGTHEFGGVFSFGYDPDIPRSTFTSVTEIIGKESKLRSREQSFATGLILITDTKERIVQMDFKPNFIKRTHGVSEGGEEAFYQQFIKNNHLELLDKILNGPFTGDSSVTFKQSGHQGFSVTLDEDLSMRIKRAD